MTLKRTDLAKQLGLKINERMKKSGAPDRFGNASAPALDRREQRRLDQERGLIPFAVKLEADLVQQLRELAASRQMDLGDLTGELLKKALANNAD